MTKRNIRVIALVGIIALFGLWLVSTGKNPSDPSQFAPASSETSTTRRPVEATPGQYDVGHPSGERARTVASILAGRRNVLEGLTEALAVFGPRDPDLISAAGMALASCGEAKIQEHVVADPRSSLQTRRQLEALEKLQIQCEGFDGVAFIRQLDTYEHKAVGNALLDPRPDVQLAAARREIATGVNTLDLSLAGHALIRQERLPFNEILGAQAASDRLPLMGTWSFAAELSTCQRQLGCGPDALQTLVICMQLGRCEPGQGYAQALEKSLPAEDFRTVLAFRQWIARQRR